MAAITEGLIRDLAAFKGERAPVTTCYLDVDGRRFPRPQQYEVHLDAMLREGRERALRQADPEAQASVEADLARMEEHVKGGLDRSRTRGLAMFSCSAHGYWQAISVPVPVRSRLFLNQGPYVRELERVVDAYERFAVLLADRQRARLFLFELGELVEKEEQFDRLPRHDDEGGDWSRDRLNDHSAALAHRHLRRTADVAFQLYREQGFDHLIIGGPDETLRDLERELHSYLRDRIAGRVSVSVHGRDEDVRQAAMEVEERVERAKEAELVRRLAEAAGAGSGAVTGLDDVLRALFERRVHTLVVAEGLEATGGRCRVCAYVVAAVERCPLCGRGMDPVDDVVEEAVTEALGQSCRVDVCRGDTELGALGGIGALLRF